MHLVIDKTIWTLAHLSEPKKKKDSGIFWKKMAVVMIFEKKIH